MQHKKVIIVGGGIAGLSCLNALLDKGITAALLESSTIGNVKMCGEFVAPIAADQLQKWQIQPLNPITQATFAVNNTQLDINLKFPAAAIARSEAELLLAKRASVLGGEIKENVNIQSIQISQTARAHQIILAEGEIIHAENLVFATGKYNPLTRLNTIPLYYGAKLNLPFRLEPHTLQMFIVFGAYLGVVPLNQHTSNSAWLISHDTFKKFGSAERALESIIQNNSAINAIFQQCDWRQALCLQGAVGKFGLKTIPNKNNKVYWIGDAIASFPPAIGYGFAHSISSAVMAAKYIAVNDPLTYHRQCQYSIKSKLRLGQTLHYIMLHKKMAVPGMALLKMSPWLVNFMQYKINEH